MSIARKPHNNTNIDQLPLSLIESSILPRLPAKAVGRCKCVCKQWKAFLSTPMFAKMHLHHVTINDYKLLLLDGPPPVKFRTLDCNHGSITTLSNPNPSVEFIFASLDGLVCLASMYPTKLAFWNPLTGAYKKLSRNPYVPSFYDTSFDVVGFYIDSSSDYKLLYLVNGGEFGAFIYSHRLDSWREIDFLDDPNIVCNRSQMIFFNHNFYFIATDMSTFNKIRSWIVCFDVTTEKFKKTRCPHVPRGARDYCGHLVVLNGCIHLCVAYTICKNYILLECDDLWRMDGVRWVKVSVFSGRNKSGRGEICMTNNGNWLAILEENDYFRKMNVKDFATYYWYFCYENWVYRSSRILFVESLVSPNP